MSFVAACFVPTLQQTIYREQVFTEKYFASSFTLTPLSYASKINFRASLCSIVLTFFASVIPLFAQKLKYCAVLLKIAIIAIVNFANQAGFALQNVNFDDFAQAMTSHKTFRLK